ncbi:hypothetical protein MHYP_G00137380 [Metynnis hypsauchen]
MRHALDPSIIAYITLQKTWDSTPVPGFLQAWLGFSGAIFHPSIFLSSHPEPAGSGSFFVLLTSASALTSGPRSRQGPDPTTSSHQG